MWQGARPTHHVSCLSLPTTFPHTHLHSPISQMDQSSRRLVSHLPRSKHPQVFAFSYTSLDFCHSNKKVNPGFLHQTRCSTKTPVLGTEAWKRKGVHSPVHAWLPHTALSGCCKPSGLNFVNSGVYRQKSKTQEHFKMKQNLRCQPGFSQEASLLRAYVSNWRGPKKWLDFMLAIHFKASL